MNRLLRIYFPWLLVFYEMTLYLANDMYLPALPKLANEFFLQQSDAQLILSCWFMGAAVLHVFVGPLADRYGRRSVLLTGGLLFCLATVLCALAPSFEFLLVARFVQGASVSSAIVAGYATIHELFSDKQAVSTLAWMASVVVLAPAFGPLLGSIILYLTSWHIMFFLLAGVGAVLLVFLKLYMPETRPQELREKFKARVIAKHYAQVLSNRGFMINTLAFSFLFAGMIAWIAEGPFLTMNFLHKRPIEFGLYQLIIFATFALGTQLVKELLVSINSQQLLRLALGIIILACVIALTLAWIFPHNLFGLFIGLLLYSFGAGLCFSLLQRMAITLSEAPMGIRMAVFAVITTSFAAMGSVLTTFTTHEQVVSFAILLAILGLLGCSMKLCIPHPQITLSDD